MKAMNFKRGEYFSWKWRNGTVKAVMGDLGKLSSFSLALSVDERGSK